MTEGRRILRGGSREHLDDERGRFGDTFDPAGLQGAGAQRGHHKHGQQTDETQNPKPKTQTSCGILFEDGL